MKCLVDDCPNETTPGFMLCEAHVDEWGLRKPSPEKAIDHTSAVEALRLEANAIAQRGGEDAAVGALWFDRAARFLETKG